VTDVPITFGPWEPDRAPHMSPALSEAINILPMAGAYAPVAGVFPMAAQTLPSRVYGFFAVPLPDGTPLIYTATQSNIYRLATGTVTQVYTGSGLNVHPWRFAQFQGRTIAIHPDANPLGATPTGTFSALGGTPPRAIAVAVVGDFLVLGNLQNDGVDGYQPNRIRWSGFDNPDTWGTNVGTQADFQPMPDEGGPVIAITGGRTTGTVYQRRSISRMQYVGPPNVFNFDTVELARGAVAAGAVCKAGALDFFISDDGFYAWDGFSSSPVGAGRVNDWLKQRLDFAQLEKIISGYDPRSNCVWFGIPEVNKTLVETFLIYSLGENRFSTVNTPVEAITSSLTQAIALEDMPIPDTFGGSFDDPAYAGKVPILAAVNANHQYGTFSGQILAATISTGDFQSAAGSRSFVTGVRPIIDSVNATVAVGERNQQPGDAVLWASPTAVNNSGIAPQRKDGRYLRYQVKTPAGDNWTRASGIEVSLKQTGRR
jgi:hypothetical protein